MNFVLFKFTQSVEALPLVVHSITALGVTYRSCVAQCALLPLCGVCFLGHADQKGHGASSSAIPILTTMKMERNNDLTSPIHNINLAFQFIFAQRAP